MSVSRLQHITKIGVEQMGDLADSLDDPEVLRLENLDTDIAPPASAVAFTRSAIEDDDANSYLPFFGLDSIRQAAAGLVGQQAARAMLSREPEPTTGARGTIVFTNASAAFKGYPKSAAFAMACHAKAGLAQSMARELMPQGVHVVQVPVDAAIGNANPEGGRKHWLMGDTVDDNMADPDRIAELYLQLHRQHRSTWTSEVVVRPWVEAW